MKSINQWFDAYGKSHQNPINKLIHWICIPLIMLSLISLLWSLPFRFGKGGLINCGTIFIFLCILFYIRLSISLAIGMLLIVAVMVYGIIMIEKFSPLSPALTSLIIFFLAWVGQFIGHKIEGKKPSFFEDLQFLLIGPLWLLGFIYRKLQIKY